MSEKSKPENSQLPWKPGENRNASDNSIKLPVSGLYAGFAGRVLPEERRIELGLAEGATWGDAVVAGLFAAAAKGSVQAAREIREAVEGKANRRSNPVAAKGFEVFVTYEQPPLSKMMSADGPDTPQE
jgi:hypothetical protein